MCLWSRVQDMPKPYRPRCVFRNPTQPGTGPTYTSVCGILLLREQVLNSNPYMHDSSATNIRGRFTFCHCDQNPFGTCKAVRTSVVCPQEIHTPWFISLLKHAARITVYRASLLSQSTVAFLSPHHHLHGLSSRKIWGGAGSPLDELQHVDTSPLRRGHPVRL